MRCSSKSWRRLIVVLACVLAAVFYVSTIRLQNNAPAVGINRKLVCKWPPVVTDDVNQWDSGFDITICVRPGVDAFNDSTSIRYPLKALFQGAQSEEVMSFEELAELPRVMWETVKYPDVYKTYPQDVPLRQLVNDIKAGNPVAYMPKYNFPIRLLATSKSVCHAGSKHHLVLIVKSSVLRWDMRNSFREFMRLQRQQYPHLSVDYVFSLGVPREHGGRLFDRDGHVINLTGLDGDQMQAFEGKTHAVMRRIYYEIATHNDIVMADYEDTYYNLTFKTVTNYRWMSAFCGSENVELFMTMDDDHRLNFSMVDAFMQQVPEEKRRNSLFGYLAKDDMADRSPLKKLYLSHREIPWDRMCPYLRGFAQIIGPGVVDDIAIATAYTRYNYAPEDVFLGLVAYKLQVPMFDEESMFDHDLYAETNKEGRPAMVALTKHFV